LAFAAAESARGTKLAGSEGLAVLSTKPEVSPDPRFSPTELSSGSGTPCGRREVDEGERPSGDSESPFFFLL